MIKQKIGHVIAKIITSVKENLRRNRESSSVMINLPSYHCEAMIDRDISCGPVSVCLSRRTVNVKPCDLLDSAIINDLEQPLQLVQLFDTSNMKKISILAGLLLRHDYRPHRKRCDISIYS